MYVVVALNSVDEFLAATLAIKSLENLSSVFQLLLVIVVMMIMMIDIVFSLAAVELVSRCVGKTVVLCFCCVLDRYAYVVRTQDPCDLLIREYCINSFSISGHLSADA